MFIKRFSVVLIISLLFCSYIHGQIPLRKGWWKFDQASNLTLPETGFGQALSLTGTQTAIDGPYPGNGAVVMGTGSYYKMYHNISSNGGGSYVNDYTILFDFKVPSTGIWHSFFQTTVNNGNDADFFINPSGNIGVAAAGYSDYSIEPGQWYRLVISVKNGAHFTGYLDAKPFLSGTIQDIDGRFSFENPVLIFADNDGEDGEIYCSELAIWDRALDATQVQELGGFGHDVDPVVMTRIPFLQGEGAHEMTICWHDTDNSETIVKYGTDSSLSFRVNGVCELIKDPYYWHSMKLTGLVANTRYFYKVGNGNEFSGIYSFKTLPDDSYKGKLRFILLSDTHCPDSTAVNQVIRAAGKKSEELYGPDIENHINGIFHSGDIVVDGSILEQYTTQFFKPLSVLSANIPTMAVAGNHEAENKYFYQYMKLDDQSAFPDNPMLNEKLWSLRVGNSVFIGVNSNIIEDYGVQEAIWLDSKLNESESDTTIDFVFVFMHHFPYSELWDVSDESILWVKNSVLTILKKYSKVRELHYGHTHGYERGTILSDRADGDFSIVCGGGGGGGLDPWNSTDNHDYSNIHISYSVHFFQILDIDIASHSYQTTVYGVENGSGNSKIMDVIYRKKIQPPPGTPVVTNLTIQQDSILIVYSPYQGTDSLMSVQLQVIQNNNQVILDTTIQWRNIYGLDAYNNPDDRNQHINLNQIALSSSLFSSQQSYLIKVRYRDHNLKWSDWSADYPLSATGLNNRSEVGTGYKLYQNYPNPYSEQTTIPYFVPEKCAVRFKIYDMKNCLVASINEGKKDKGLYNLVFKNEYLPNGSFSYQMVTDKIILAGKMVKIQ